MKNTMKLGSAPKTVPQQELIDAMDPRKAYSQDQVMDLLPGQPRVCVRDTLHILVERGVVWRNANKKGAIRYTLLQGEKLQDAIEKKTKVMEPPEWMRKNLVGYERSQNGFRDLCLLARK
jgi:Fe2+ or Zn2+ uptake regulation protein